MQIKDYKTLKIGLYKEICEISNDEYLEEIDKQVKIVALLNEMTEDEVLELPIKDYAELAKGTQFLSKKDSAVNTIIPDSYAMGDWVLIPTKDVDKMTTAQYIDFQTFSTDLEDNFERLLSCFLIPKDCKYNQGYDIKKLQKDICDEMSVHDALCLLGFFFEQLSGSTLNILNYSKQMVEGIKDKETRETILKEIEKQMHLLENGDGSQM